MAAAAAEREEKKIPRNRLKPLMLLLPPALLTALFLVFSSSRSLANAAVKGFSRPAKDFLGTVSGIFPFSVMELMYTAAGLGLIVFIVLMVRASLKADKKLRTLFHRFAVFLLAVFYILSAYLWLLGIDYRADTFEERSGLMARKISARELYAVADYFVTNAARLADTVKRDENGHFAEDIDEIFARSESIYAELAKEFPCLDCASRAPKKMALYSKLSSLMGFTGVFFPFTGESCINIDAPRSFIPFTVAHELAHQRSVYAEQEANFLGVAASISSSDPAFVYSGYLSGSVYLMNALLSVDREAWRTLAAKITGGMLVDWTDNNEYWTKFETKLTKVSETVYDGFLKAQGQELGMRSYGACVDLLVVYYTSALDALDF